MSDDKENGQSGKATQRPSYYGYQVRAGQDGKDYFNRVGTSFNHKDGKGMTLYLDAFPVDGRVVLRTPKERVQDLQKGSISPASRESGREER